MIADLQDCSEEELQHQINNLERTPVRGIAELLLTRQCVLNKGFVRSLTQLGELKTEFGNIGSLVPNAAEGERKFRVAEIVPALKNASGIDDGGLLKRIEEFIEKDKRGEIHYNVTILKYRNDLVVKDGNKRTIAFYEGRKGSFHDAIAFPVFIVQFTDHGT